MHQALAVVFAEYHIAAYADGEPKVLIPYYELKELAAPRGALATLLPPG
ncbi:MAG TPA: DUF3298 domain-containing protein [Pyrinomonadaceae bacterium]|jgi:hypothetical protein|nr:DUF3298 domain-containing protein [Pyrinomonadaceae bacterium]